jgi:glucose-6-phosphate-specific signal transduction histidine kinase
MSIKLKALNNREILNYIRVSLLIVTILAALEGTLYMFSLNYVVYAEWVSWYFPVGANLVAFILLPLRYWPAVFIGMDAGQIGFHYLYYDLELDNLWFIFSADWMHKTLLLMPLIYIKYRGIPLEIDRFKGLILILGVTLFYRGVRSIDLILHLNSNLEDYYRNIPDEMIVQVIVSHILGGFVGILFALMIAYSGLWLWRNYNKLEWYKLLQFMVSLAVLLLATYTTYHFQPEVMYLLRMIGVLAFIWFAYKFGWIGVIGAALGLNSLILIVVYGVNDTAIMLENQTILTTYGLTALLLGALVNEYNVIKHQLVENNQLLILKNTKLVSLNENIQQLSEKVIDVQEQERKMFSQALHDELGQNIVALKIGLQIMEKEMQTATLDGVDLVNQSVSAIHSSMYDLMSLVSPIILEEGLFAALDGPYFREKLKNSHIEYHTNLLGNTEALSEAHRIAIFRIIQEAVTNTIKYSQAKNFLIDLIIEEKFIILKIKDDGIGTQNKNQEQLTGGFGLTGIKDRVFALSGTIELISENGFYIAIEIPNHNKSKFS